MYKFLVQKKWLKFQPHKNDNFQVWKTLRNILAMLLREKSCVNMTMMDGNIDVDGDHVEGNNEDEHCDLTCWMELVTVSRESKEFATRSIFPENIYY